MFEALAQIVTASYLRMALLALLLLAPAAGAMGVQVIGYRMAFFTDAVSHSAFLGVALGLLFAMDPWLSMALFGVLVALLVVAYMRRTRLPADAVIGVVFAGVVAAGLALISARRDVAGQIPRYIYGDLLTVTSSDIAILAVMLALVVAFQVAAYNHTVITGISPALARLHGVPVALWQYVFAVLVALVVMLSVRAVGVFLVTAMLIVPPTAARRLARTAGEMFWWSQVVALTSSVLGLAIAVHPRINAAPGALAVLVALAWLAVSSTVAETLRRLRSRVVPTGGE